jgi:hypothetical protein
MTVLGDHNERDPSNTKFRSARPFSHFYVFYYKLVSKSDLTALRWAGLIALGARAEAVASGGEIVAPRRRNRPLPLNYNT